AALAPAQLPHRLVNDFPGEPEATQEIAHYLLGGIGIAFRPDGTNDGLVVRQALEMLIVVPKLHEMSAVHGARIRILLAEKYPEQRGLAAAVGAKDAKPAAALHAESQVRKKRPIKGLGEAVNLQNDIAGTPDFAEMHLGRLDQHRPIHAL